MDVPCIHDICSKFFNETILYDTIKFSSLDFKPIDQNTIKLEIYEIETELTFNKKTITTNNNNNNNDMNHSALAFNPDYDIEDDPISYIIKHTEFQLSSVIQKHNINLAIAGVQLYDKMMKDDKFLLMKTNNQPLFWANYQMSLWENVLQGRKPIRI